MAPKSKTLIDYERQRLENISRNQEMMSALMLQRKAADLSAHLSAHLSAALRLKPAVKKPKPVPKAKPPIVRRRSLRTHGITPSSSASAAADGDAVPQPPPPSSPPRERGPLLIRDAFVASGPRDSDSALIAAIAGSSTGSDSGPAKEAGFDPRSELVLRPENVAKVVGERILSVQFLPFGDRAVVVIGNKIGNLGFWDVNFSNSEGEDDGIYVYHPHSAPVSGISVHPFSPRKIYTCSFDGLIRLMDVEKETFNMIISSGYDIHSICQWPQDVSSLYIGEGAGILKIWDEREGKDSSFWNLHEGRIHTIDFHPGNAHLMATSSVDASVCIWDLRSMKRDGPESVKRISHERSVQSAYFSPTGKYLGTTSVDDKVGIASGSNFDDMLMVSHDRWSSTFRAIWGWDDSYLFVGNTERAIDVISTSNVTTTPLESPDMTSIPCRFAAHPYMLGHLAGTTLGGKVYLWTKE